MNVNPGELNKKIKIIKKVETRDSEGYSTYTDEVVKECSASFNRTSGTEINKANADFSQINVRFLIRYTNTPITRKMLVEYQNTQYQIKYINDYQDNNEYIEIWCEVVEV